MFVVAFVGATKPQCGTQIGSSPLQHVRAHAHPGGHWLDFVQAIACGFPQLIPWWQWQQPSTVTTQPQPEPQTTWLAHVPQPPTPVQDVDGGNAAPAVPAVTREPAPIAAAPMPARLSSRPRVTRFSDTAMRTTS
jgi:hypothetical protein